ncbi:hypothetical protein [Ruania halotolerans]|uniref:hypothetical protein n=1 Tax=Ruania halotolerans TaxID=2897773 RepID=UPI001E35CE97|nr:hypothetical protein [Ruania halotolerans]UFU04736.1 hypothetical protein LQF10_09545 [Ruania halotolerans]
MSVPQVLLTVGVVLAALGLSSALGAPLTGWVLARVTRKAPAAGNTKSAGAANAGTGEEEATEPRAPEEVLRGGLWIGILERLALTGTILVGYPAGIAVVVAVKGLGRFRTLDGEAGVSERFLVGTLTSYLWACAIGAGALGLLRLLT